MKSTLGNILPRYLNTVDMTRDFIFLLLSEVISLAYIMERSSLHISFPGLAVLLGAEDDEITSHS